MADSQRKSYNLFDKDNADIRECYVWNDRNYVASSQNTRSAILACKPNTTYTVSKTLSDRFAIAYTNTDPTLDDNTPAYGVVVDNDATSITITTGGSAQYLVIFFIYIPAETKTVEEIVATIMVNEGQTAKPYEPYGWVHSLRKLTTATEAVENPLYSDGTAITAYTIKGNATQSGTPTPSNPVEVSGVGEMSANLVSMSEPQGDGYLANSVIGIDNQGCQQTISTPNFFVTEYIPVSEGTYYYYSDLYRATGANAKFVFYNVNKELISYTERQPAMEEQPVYELSSFSAPANTAYMRMNIDKLSTKNCLYTSQLPSYEPYGQYKIPISNGVVTTNIYLGNVQSTRRIDKIVYKGSSDENWKKSSTAHNGFYIAIPNHESNTPLFCNMAQYDADGALYRTTPWYCVSDWTFGISTDSAVIGGTTVEDWKAYLATLYANGTPLTIWHIRPEINTVIGIVNEPLLKISDVSDIITGSQTTISIPSTDGANSITVDTTVQPSEFTATWTGWHDSYVKEKSENLWDEDYTNISSDIYYKPVYVGDYEIVTVSSAVPLTSQNFTNLFALSGQQSSGASTSNNGVYSGRSIAARPVDGYITIAYRNINGVNPQDYDTMVNEGRTALPYEPYWK